MITVKPGENLTQVRGEVVIYQLRFEDWSTDLVKPDSRAARIACRTIVGEPLAMKVLPYTAGSQMHQVRISGGGRKRCEYEVTYTVRSADEVRIRSFFLRMV